MGKIGDLKVRMESVCNVITDYASPSSRKQFLIAIMSATEDYLVLSNQVKVAGEIRVLEEKLRRGSEIPRNLVDNLSTDTLEFINVYGEIPDFSALTDPEEISDATLKFLGVVTSSSKIVIQKSQRRFTHTSIGQISRGRHRHREEEFFVGRLATAYSAATGKSTDRSWSNERQTDFEVIVELTLDALNVDENISAKKLVEHQIRNRNNSK